MVDLSEADFHVVVADHGRHEKNGTFGDNAADEDDGKAQEQHDKFHDLHQVFVELRVFLVSVSDGCLEDIPATDGIDASSGVMKRIRIDGKVQI